MNERGHGIHHHQHDGGERVDADHPVGGQRAGIDPAEQFHLLDARLVQEADKHVPGEGSADAQQRSREVHGPLRAMVMTVVTVIVVMAVMVVVMIMTGVGMMLAIDVGIAAKALEHRGAKQAGDQRAAQRQEYDGR